MRTRILILGLFATALVFAQGRGGGGGGGSRGGGATMSGPMGPATRLERWNDALKLTKDQKRDIKAAMDDAQKEATPVHERLAGSQLAVAEAIAAAKPQADIDSAVRAAAEVDTQLTFIELRAFAKVVALLQPDQKQRGVPMVFAMIRGAFNGKNWNSD